MLNNNEIEVIEASATVVEIKVGNIHLRFRSDGKKMGLVAKSDPFREIYDEKTLWVSKKLFKKACRQAAQIMADKRLAVLRQKAISSIK